MRTGEIKQNDQLGVALMAAVLDPQNLNYFFRILSQSDVVFSGFVGRGIAGDTDNGRNGGVLKDVMAGELPRIFHLTSFKESDDTGVSNEIIEFVPFFTTQGIARRLMEKMGLSESNMHYLKASAADFFSMVLQNGQLPRLDPGWEFSRMFSIGEMREVIDLAKGGQKNNEGPGKVQPKGKKARRDESGYQFDKLRDEYSRPIQEKINACLPSGTLPPTLAETIDLAENCLGGQLVFDRNIKESTLFFRRFDREKTIKLAWRMFLSLAQTFHIMRFEQKTFSARIFVEETGLALLLPEGSDGVYRNSEQYTHLYLTDLIERDLRLQFSILEAEKKFFIHGLELYPISQPS